MALDTRTDNRAARDLLSIVSRHTPPYRLKDFDEEDLTALMEYARPGGGTRRDSYFMALQRSWFVNILYYVGIQPMEVPRILEDVDPGLMLEQGHFIANHILRMVQSNVARLSQARADWSVIPNTPDQVDQQGAQYAQHLLDYAYDHLDMQSERLLLSLWLDICGTAYIYANWDQTKGSKRKVYIDPMRGEPMPEQHLMPQQKQWLDRMQSFAVLQDGDWELETLGPFHVITPPGFTKLERMPWMLVRRRMSMDAIWDRWPKRAPELSPEDMSSAVSSHFWDRLPILVHRPGLGLGGHANDEEGAVIDELWIPPSKRIPDGLTLFMSQRQVLEAGPHTFAKAGIDLRYPLVDFHNKRVPGRFHSMGTVEHLIGPQMDYNRARQQIIQQRDVMGVPQFIAPKGAVDKTIRNEMGDIMEYRPSVGKPELLNPPTLADATVLSSQQAQQDMQMMAALGEASLGQNPSGVRAGSQIQSLMERDQMAITPSIMDMEHSFERLGCQILKLAWKFMQLPRAIHIYGEARHADIKYFKGSDINGNTHVIVKPGSMMPRSKAQTYDMVMALLERQALNPANPRHQRMIFEALEVGGTDRLFLVEEGHRRRARIENLMFSRPEPRPDFAFPDVNIFDDHQAHWEEHEAFFVSDEFEMLDPQRKLYFLAHMQKHMMAASQMIEAAMTAQQVAGGGGGSPQARPLGQPSPPNQGQGNSKPNPQEAA